MYSVGEAWMRVPRQTDKGGGLEHDADFDLGIAFLNALQRAARYAGAFCQFRRAQPAFLAGKPDKLAKQRNRVKRLPGIRSVFDTGHGLNWVIYKPYHHGMVNLWTTSTKYALQIDRPAVTGVVNKPPRRRLSRHFIIYY
jgi:hypothetical protein